MPKSLVEQHLAATKGKGQHLSYDDRKKAVTAILRGAGFGEGRHSAANTTKCAISKCMETENLEKLSNGASICPEHKSKLEQVLKDREARFEDIPDWS